MVIDDTDNRKLQKYATEHALPWLVAHMAGDEAYEKLSNEALYHRAVKTFIRHVLSTGPGIEAGPHDAQPTIPGPGITLEPRSIPPEAVGGLYEYLRGFRLSFGEDDTPVLIPSPSGKRNQGLFYTPANIVRFIVSQVLDALEPANPREYLDLKIVDPAVGTGVFLSGMLDEITRRVASIRSSENHSPLPLLEQRLSRSVQEESRAGRGPLGHPAAVHCLRQCLYGVDVDAVAVEIARAKLHAKVFPQSSPGSEMIPHLKAGNALMGSVDGRSGAMNQPRCDAEHARLFFGRTLPDSRTIVQWARSRRLFHWHLEFPDVFSGDSGGFHAVVGNPPYEILSVKESGIEARRHEQAYFRKAFSSCKGKINTYRLMIERGLDLLREDGVLGFIVPATLLADSTSAVLREIILDKTRVISAVVIPEKARVFDGVTQALLILIVRKGGATSHIAPLCWEGKGEIPSSGGLKISRAVIRHCDGRIPLVKSDGEKKLLVSLAGYPPLHGDQKTPPAGSVHQGEINLTTHRSLITDVPTGLPLIRGEHVYPFRVLHPTPGKKRLDWILRHARSECGTHRKTEKVDSDDPGPVPTTAGTRGSPWKDRRIVLGRVVNMGTKRRLKAALVPPGCYLGDMTNFMTDFQVPIEYVLCLLNSSLLNWRFKATSTNNYLSAREIELLPIVRPPRPRPDALTRATGGDLLERLMPDAPVSIADSLPILRSVLGPLSEPDRSHVLIEMITRLGERLTSMDAGDSHSAADRFLPLLDGLVLALYGVEEHANIVSL